VLDVQGYFSAVDGPDGSRFRPIAPTRALDGRFEGPGFLSGTHDGYIDLNRTCPDATAAVLNITAIAAGDGTYVTVFPGGAVPYASNLNVPSRSVAANLVIAGISGNRVRLYSAANLTYVIADVLGCFEARALNDSGRFFPFTQPARVFDTRDRGGPLGDGWYLDVPLASDEPGRSPIPAPASGGAAVLMNVTVTEPTSVGVVVAYPSGLGVLPSTSTLNFAPGDTVANAAVTPLGPDGHVHFANAGGDAHLLADISGWFSNAML
jgi:hypothetical protein